MASAQPTDPLLFVYGTLRADVGHPLHALISKNAKNLGPAVFQGRLFDFGAYPGVIDSSDSRDAVYGEVYHITSNVELVFARLDAYEECGPEFPQPTEYLRVKRPVRLLDAQDPKPDGHENFRDAYLYLYNASTDRGALIAHGDYLKKNTR